MKKSLLIVFFGFISLFCPMKEASAQIPIIGLIKQVVSKVIKAIDLQIQRLQNETIELQNAQKTLENALSKLKLDEISDWVEKQRKLFADYYDELRQVKQAITIYRSVKDIIAKQAGIVSEYKQAYELFKQDDHFTTDEIAYMGEVYAGIIDESLKSIDEILLVTSSLSTQMTDAKRLEIINQAASKIDLNETDLRKFNNSNMLISLQRAKDETELNQLRKIYGIE